MFSFYNDKYAFDLDVKDRKYWHAYNYYQEQLIDKMVVARRLLVCVALFPAVFGLLLDPTNEHVTTHPTNAPGNIDIYELCWLYVLKIKRKGNLDICITYIVTTHNHKN